MALTALVKAAVPGRSGDTRARRLGYCGDHRPRPPPDRGVGQDTQHARLVTCADDARQGIPAARPSSLCMRQL